MEFDLKQNAFGRWIIVNPDDENFAWTGSRWTLHEDGLPAGPFQICNFATREEAASYAEHIGQKFCEVCGLWYDVEDPCRLH